MKEQLIEALKEERERLKWHTSIIDHDSAIDFLETGLLPLDFQESELIYNIIHNFDDVCSDYGITE